MLILRLLKSIVQNEYQKTSIDSLPKSHPWAIGYFFWVNLVENHEILNSSWLSELFASNDLELDILSVMSSLCVDRIFSNYEHLHV